MALIGHVDDISRSHVEGWVFDTERSRDVTSVSFFANGVHRGTCVTTHERKDLVLPDGMPTPDKCAFWFAFDPPLSPFVELRIQVVETWSGQVLPNGAHTLPAPATHGRASTALTPILLTSTGRTGTTMLMSEFARHPDIVLGDHFPYEIKQIAYHAAAFRALAADADWERSTTPETMLAPDMSRIVGSNPYNMTGLFDLGGGRRALRNFYHGTVPSGYATLFRSFILEFYATLRDAQGKRTAAFFCEKGDIDDAAVQGVRSFFNTVKDIVIVRDPRDLLCSAIAFWKLKPDAAMSMLATTVPRLARLGRNAGPDTKVIRYEELVSEPAGTRRVLSEFLGLDLLSVSGAEGAIPDSHRTSRDPAASIGRWREDLTSRQVELCESVFGLYMREFGYELSASRPMRSGDDLVAAEGPLAVAALLENTQSDTEDGRPSRRTLELTFGRGATGEPFMLDGWSFLERGFVWSCDTESRLVLPAIRDDGEYRLHITVAPFTHGTELASQRITVLIGDIEMGTARAGDVCILSIAVPPAVVASKQKVELTLRFPDAARPSDIVGSGDDRLLGFSLYRLALFRAETRSWSANIDDDGDEIESDTNSPEARRFAMRLTEMLREISRRPALNYRAKMRLRDIPGFDDICFVNLIFVFRNLEYGLTLPEDDVDSLDTMGDVIALLSRHGPDRRQSGSAPH